MNHFDFKDRVRLNCRVTNISKGSDGRHIVQYIDSSNPSNPSTMTIRADFVSICSGLHVTPSWPEIPGIDYVLNPKIPPLADDPIPHQVYHSSEYRGRHQLAGRRVMVLGTGETGHDLAYEASKAGATQVVLCTRGGFLSFPKVLVSIGNGTGYLLVSC